MRYFIGAMAFVVILISLVIWADGPARERDRLAEIACVEKGGIYYRPYRTDPVCLKKDVVIK